MLQGWSQVVSDTDPIHDAAQLVIHQRPSSRKARLLVKLSLLAADKGDRDLTRTLMEEAISASSPATPLGRALRMEGMNIGIVIEESDLLDPLDGMSEDALLRPDDLADLQLRAARGALEESLEDRLGGTWRYTIRMGVRPLDELNTAHARATWSGLPWARREIQKQSGLQLLAGGAEGPEQWAHGVLFWILGNGRQVDFALRLAEPHFDEMGADFVLRGIRDFDPSRHRFERLAELGSEGWDLFSEDTLRWLVDEVQPLDGEVPPAPQSRHIWAGFAIRLPMEWYQRYRDLGPAIQTQLLEHLTPYALRHFDKSMRATMYGALGSDDALEADGGALLPLASSLAASGEEDRLRRIIDRAQLHPRVLAQMIEERRDLVSPHAEKRMLSRLRAATVEQRREAAAGTVGLGGAGPRIELGRMLSLSARPPRALINLLLAEATDPDAPPQYVTEAREGLVLLRRRFGLRAADRRRLREAPDHAGQGPFDEGFTRAVLRLRLLQVLADRPSKTERAELVAAVRSPEDRVRDIAVNACTEALGAAADEGLAWAVVSGLFDPSDTVAAGALAGLSPLTDNFSAAADVAWQRLPELFASSGRRVRAEIVAAVSEARPRNRHQRDRRRVILARADQDRSWLVRDRLAQGSRR